MFCVLKVRRLCSRYNPVVYRFSIAHRVKEIKERFDGIEIEMRRFSLIESQASSHNDEIHLRDQELSDRMSHSFVKASMVIGRDGDKAKVIDMLKRRDDSDGEKNLSLVPIVGIRGLGKTTLAQLVYNDKTVQDLFELKIWVCVSTDFDVCRILRDILKSSNVQGVDGMLLDGLQKSVREKLGGKKFLLVLDDVWNEDRHKWLKLQELLTDGAEGSKVIVTARTITVSSAMTNTPPHELKGLSEADSLSLFFKCSLGQHKPFEDFGKVIAKKCCGHPLVLTTIGSRLKNRPEVEWKSVRDSKLWKMEKVNGHVFSALRMSYDAMPCSMKQCFSYCSTFQEDASMYGLNLQSIWMALGLLKPLDKMELEDVGYVQFKEQCDRSFLQPTDDGPSDYTLNGIPSCFNMHDLIHELSCSVRESDCAVIKPGMEKEKLAESLRYLRILYDDDDSISVVQSLTKLWSLHIDSIEGQKDISDSFISMCIKQLRYLRVFDLNSCEFKVLPSSIGNLRHLRYLDVSYKTLPNSICKLQSLQTLLLFGCRHLKELPKDMINLVSLRTLVITTEQTHFSEKGIGCLKSLRILYLYRCKNLASLPNDMMNCTTLRELIIEDCSRMDLASTDDALYPLSIQLFVLINIPETKAFPQWMKGASGTLKKVVLEGCSKLVALPEWFQDCTLLDTLIIRKCESLLGLPDGMHRLASLVHLEVGDCNKIELVSKHTEAVQLGLTKFIIYGLSCTTALPSWLRGASRSLEVLKITHCSSLTSVPDWLSSIVSLQELEIKDCGELSALPVEIYHMASLMKLVIGCKKLEWPSESYQGDRLSLKHIEISSPLRMEIMPRWIQQASYTLVYLRIYGCLDLIALPEWLPDLTSLQRLEIERCTRLRILPEGISRLKSLTHLAIKCCDYEFRHRYHPTGDDWANISHVPNVDIDFPAEYVYFDRAKHYQENPVIRRDGRPLPNPYLFKYINKKQQQSDSSLASTSNA